MAASIHDEYKCTTCTKVCTIIDTILRVFNIYGWILDSYVVDFFQENLEERLPNSWRLMLNSASPGEIGAWISGDISCTRVWPLSLLAYRQVINTLQLNRNHINPDSVICCNDADQAMFNGGTKPIFKSESEKSSERLNILRSKCHNLFKKHVKEKKRYEIEEMAKICANCAEESNCNCIVDIGAGMGHLARVLAFQYDFCVTCIEQEPLLSQQARKCDEELMVSIRKHLPDFCGRSPQHIPVKWDASSHMESEFINYLQDIFINNFHVKGKEFGFGLVGLHPCGDLATTLLRFYSISDKAKFICIVGCCYMKLSLETELTTLRGYPLSNYLLSKRHKLSYTALEVACHAIEKYCDKLKTGDYEDLIVHAYRAALETILIRKDARLRHTQLKNVKVTKDMSFEEYCIAATQNLDSKVRPTAYDFENPEILRFLKCWKQVVIFGSLRLMLAPLVETIVLLDRFLFLSERNLKPTLKPVFDARLSPRNFVLISTKTGRDNIT